MSMSEWVHVYGSRDHPRCCSTSFWDCFSLGPKHLELSFSWLTDESQWFLPHNSLSNTVDIPLNGCQGLISGPYATRASITLVGQLLSSSFYSTLLFSALLHIYSIGSSEHLGYSSLICICHEILQEITDQ